MRPVCGSPGDTVVLEWNARAYRNDDNSLSQEDCKPDVVATVYFNGDPDGARVQDQTFTPKEDGVGRYRCAARVAVPEGATSGRVGLDRTSTRGTLHFSPESIESMELSHFPFTVPCPQDAGIDGAPPDGAGPDASTTDGKAGGSVSLAVNLNAGTTVVLGRGELHRGATEIANDALGRLRRSERVRVTPDGVAVGACGKRTDSRFDESGLPSAGLDVGPKIDLGSPPLITLQKQTSNLYATSGQPTDRTETLGKVLDVAWAGGPDAPAGTMTGKLAMPPAFALTAPDQNATWSIPNGAAPTVTWVPFVADFFFVSFQKAGTEEPPTVCRFDPGAGTATIPATTIDGLATDLRVEFVASNVRSEVKTLGGEAREVDALGVVRRSFNAQR